MAINDSYNRAESAPSAAASSADSLGPTAMQNAFNEAAARATGTTPAVGADNGGDAAAASEVVEILGELASLRRERLELLAQLEQKADQMTQAFSAITQLAKSVGGLQDQVSKLIDVVKPVEPAPAVEPEPTPAEPPAAAAPRQRPLLDVVKEHPVKATFLVATVVGAGVGAYGFAKGWFNKAADAAQEAIA